ncbi:GspH/FimT family protein [Inmirania thermothiophila]|uniref:Type II secretion system protein H n=1 Tax=Inmirania thermothiophila TaxID=1750597 RepID=A0A3N1Y4N2_9GAMM|nr:GspH/FimT family pseudopilin [Inmirania thermothiophila]ROR32572.1 type IV fimbrial biogenesis protein FimT [Inmirania thermothiophila]
MDGRASRRGAGYTLQEALVALAVGAFVTAGVVPTLADLVAGERVTAALNDLLADLHAARAAAVQRRGQVVLCPSADGAACLAEPHWERGWIVFVDTDRDREHDAGEPLLSAHGRLAGLTLRSSLARRRIAYRPDGTSPGTNATLTACPATDVPPRRIVLSNTGRPRIAEAAPSACAGTA